MQSVSGDQATLNLSSLITATSSLGMAPRVMPSGVLMGRITARSTARLDQPWGMSARITATSSAALANLPPPDNRLWLTGKITAASSARMRWQPSGFLAGEITTQATARLALAGEALAARVVTASYMGGSLTFGTFLKGNIQTTSWAGISALDSCLRAQITATSGITILPLPLIPAPQPPDCTLDVTLDDYLDLITSEHIGKPNYTQAVTASVQPFVDDQVLTAGMPCLYDIDLAVGVQLDAVGQWVGKTRYVNLGDVFFSWDTPGLGWDEANWRGPFDPPDALAELDDAHYRLLLYATIAANHWDGSIPSAYASWDTLFSGTGYEVMIQDYGNMTMAMALRGTGPIDAVTQALFQSGEMDLKPEGIELIDYVFQAAPGVPFFAFDANTDSAAGWDTGYWGVLVPPGQGYVPEQDEGE